MNDWVLVAVLALIFKRFTTTGLEVQGCKPGHMYRIAYKLRPSGIPQASGDRLRDVNSILSSCPHGIWVKERSPLPR